MDPKVNPSAPYFNPDSEIEPWGRADPVTGYYFFPQESFEGLEIRSYTDGFGGVARE